MALPAHHKLLKSAEIGLGDKDEKLKMQNDE
jgi:hypothetical protein